MKQTSAAARSFSAVAPSLIHFLLAGLALFTAGCGRKAITSLQRKQAAAMVSEAEFANTLRDYPRAEKLYAQAVVLCPDLPDYWLNLGAARRRQGNRSGAQQAYEEVLGLAQDAYQHHGKDPQPLLQQAYALALLGRLDDARAVLAKAQKNHPDDRDVRVFMEHHQLDRLVAEPLFKQIAL